MFEDIKARDEASVLQTYARFPVALKEGRNALCRDWDGREFIDFTSGIGVNSLGFCDPGWVGAVSGQLGSLQHTSNLYYTLPGIQAAEALTSRTGMKKAFFCNSGAEANEGAIKAARKYSFMKYGKGRARIITLENSFHGRTITTLAATGQEAFHNYFFPFTEGFAFASPDSPGAIAAMADDSVCAVMLELVQGEGGVIPLKAETVAAIAGMCAQRDILLIIDEVQTGIGRTGTLFCCEQYGIVPDIMTVAKGLGGGLPLGAVLFGEKAEAALGKGDHATTFGANPAVCAGACEVLRRMDASFLGEVRHKGQYIQERLLAMPHIASVTGIGMMLGAELTGADIKAVLAAGIREGVLLLSAKNKLRLLPPLSIPDADLDRGLDALRRALASL
jgi:acetylornithine/N-succinyldiaminopimelate aminotransferase